MRELLGRAGLRDLAIVVADRPDMLLAIVEDGTVRWRSDTGARYLLGCPGDLRDVPLTDLLGSDDVRRLQRAVDRSTVVVHPRRWDNGKPVPLRTVAWTHNGFTVVVAVAPT